MEDFDTDRLDHYLAMYLFEQEVMEEAKKTAERPEEYAQVLAIMWNDTKRDVARKCQEAAFEMIEAMFRLQRLGFDRVEEFGEMRKRDRRTARERHGIDVVDPETGMRTTVTPVGPVRYFASVQQQPPPESWCTACDCVHAEGGCNEVSNTGFMRAVWQLIADDDCFCPPHYLTVREAAETIGCSLPTIRRWVEGTALPHLTMRSHALRALRAAVASKMSA